MDYQSLSIDELVRECAERPCPAAWEEFMRRFQRLIARVAMKACREWGGASPDVIEDRIQDTLLKLMTDNCALLRNFRPHHPDAFLGYLKVLTANVVFDHFRAEHAGKRDVGNTIELNEALHHLDSGAGSMDATELEIFLKEVNDILLRRGTGPAEEKERAIFWLYYRHGLTAKTIASIRCMKLTVKGIESTIHRLTAYVKHALVYRENNQGEAGIGAS